MDAYGVLVLKYVVVYSERHRVDIPGISQALFLTRLADLADRGLPCLLTSPTDPVSKNLATILRIVPLEVASLTRN